jgi:hypothetical protein
VGGDGATVFSGKWAFAAGTSFAAAALMGRSVVRVGTGFGVLALVAVAACGGRAASVGSSGGSSGTGSGDGLGSGSGSGTGSGAGSSSGDTAGGCDGDPFLYCDSHGEIAKGCCPTNAVCAPVAPYCDLGGGACAPGACPSDAGAKDTPCGTKTCTGGDVCVVTKSGGGPCLLPDDDGNCPDGLPPNGTCCNRMTTTYACEPLPTKCKGTLACPCATSLCQCGGCQLADTPNTLSCGCFYP